MKPQGRVRLEAQQSLVRWIPPPSELMKINVDAALAKNSTKVFAGAVAQDINGKFLGASTVILEGRMELDTVEAIMCKEGLALASNLVLRDFRLVCDNARVIRSIQEGSMGSYGHVVQEI